MSRYKHKIPRDDLKRFGKEIAKKLVNSDYKAGRVKDPTKIDEKQQKKVKIFCKDYFEKAAQKHKKHEAEKQSRSTKKDAHRTSKISSAKETPSQSPNQAEEIPSKLEASDDEEDIKMSDNELEPDDRASGSPSIHNGTLKRKRLETDISGIKDEDDFDILQSPAKKLNFDSEATSPHPPPPPPPAPPAETPSDTGTPIQELAEDEMETDLHADTNFKGKSMADVLAQAQQEGDDEDEGTDDEYTSKSQLLKSESPETKFEAAIGTNGLKMENPLTDGQEIVEHIKEELEG